jgi:exosome complex protein LRP1
MTSETNKVKAKLAALSASFDDLEVELEPLFSQTLPETIIGLESIQKAKLQTVLPYLVYDLIFSRSPLIALRKIDLDAFFPVYLKSRGIDPKTHPVVPELV